MTIFLTPYNPLPGDPGIFRPNRFGNLSTRLSDDLEVTDHSIDGLFVPEEVLL